MSEPKPTLYESALVHLPDGRQITIQAMIDIITLDTLTPNRIRWIELMVNDQLREDNASDALKITPGCSDYVYRQIIVYAMDSFLWDSEL